MSTLSSSASRADKPVRAGVLAASLAIAACFGAAFGLADEPAQAAETIEQAATR